MRKFAERAITVVALTFAIPLAAMMGCVYGGWMGIRGVWDFFTHDW